MAVKRLFNYSAYVTIKQIDYKGVIITTLQNKKTNKRAYRVYTTKYFTLRSLESAKKKVDSYKKIK